ncbi:MAG: hypothetical protein H7249_18805 [Chitinophagaceae bacterium]|nr:hypothetical protein [Oligoflexus sp.]
MHRSLDFTPVDDEVIVSRILMQVHQAIDEAFPNAQPASARFAKTAFTGYDEPTLTQVAPSEALREAAEAGRLEDAGDDLLGGDPELQRFGSRSSRRQTLIGLAIIVIVGIIAYFAMQR